MARRTALRVEDALARGEATRYDGFESSVSQRLSVAEDGTVRVRKKRVEYTLRVPDTADNDAIIDFWSRDIFGERAPARDGESAMFWNKKRRRVEFDPVGKTLELAAGRGRGTRRYKVLECLQGDDTNGTSGVVAGYWLS